MTALDKTGKLIIRAVIENTIDQLAIVGGTIQLSLPSQGKVQIYSITLEGRDLPMQWSIILADSDFFQQSESVSAADFRGRLIG